MRGRDAHKNVKNGKSGGHEGWQKMDVNFKVINQLKTLISRLTLQSVQCLQAWVWRRLNRAEITGTGTV